MNMINKEAPNFVAAAVLRDGSIKEDFCLHEEIKDRFAVLFFYPLDFTFVCPSELIAFSHRAETFAKRDTVLISVSIDSEFTHLAWRNTPVEKGGVGPINYPMVADPSHRIVNDYGVQAASGDVALRATFLIDQKGLIRHQSINDLPLGRNVDEYIRLVDALQFHQSHGEVCPAGWQSGEAGMTANPEGVASYLAQHAKSL
ncbi:MAG: peroxiredoxin [Pseudomonadales bacterium]|nr:peroxiredoxin [Pseudomonadales bacterium]